MNRQPVARGPAPQGAAFVTYALLFAALTNLVDGRPLPLAHPTGLAVLSDVDRSGVSLSGRERGMPFHRRGVVQLPDLFVVTPRPFPGPVSALDMEVEIPEDSWFDLLLGAAPQARTLVRLARRPGQSFVARIPANQRELPEERPVEIDASCLGGVTPLLVERQGRSARVHAGDCPPIMVEDPPDADASMALASGLAGARLRSMRVRAANGSLWHPLIAPGDTPLRVLRSAGVAALVVLVVAVLVHRLPARAVVWRPLRTSVVWVFLVVAALPTVPFLFSVTAFLLGIVLWLDSRFRVGPRLNRLRKSRMSFLFLVAFASSPSLVVTWSEPPALPGERIAIHATPEAYDFDVHRFPASAQGVALEIEPPDSGSFRVSWGEESLDGDPPGPPVYPDLFSMSPFVLLERRGDRILWLLGLGDVVLQAGETATTDSLEVVHRQGSVVFSQAGKLLARLRGVPARAGSVRFLPIEGRLDARADLVPQDISWFEELYFGFGPQASLLAVLALIASTGGTLLQALRHVAGLALASVLLMVGLVIAGNSSHQIIAASWNLLPAIIILACIYEALRQFLRRGIRSPAGWTTAVIVLLAPNVFLPLVGGPVSERFTRPWYARLVSETAMPHLDPDGRMFNDTAITGLYHRRAIRPEPAPGHQRIVVLGGSQTYGEGFTGARPPQIWTTQLEEHLRGTEVVNLAVQGSTLSAQVERLRGLLQTERRVDRVIAVFGMNDGTLLRRSRSEVERAARVRQGVPSWRVDPCAHVATCNVLRKLRSFVALFSGRGTGTEAERRRTLVAAIEELVWLADERHFDLWLVREPQQCDLMECKGQLAAYDFPHGFDLASAALDRTHGERPVMDIRPTMRAHRARLPFFDLVHLSEEGHKIMAQALLAKGVVSMPGVADAGEELQ